MSLIESQKNFSYFYYDLWPSLIVSILVLGLTPVFRSVNYGETINSGVVGLTLMMFAQVVLGYLVIHMIFTQLGFNFLGAEIERGSNKLLLNNLEEGVIILDNESNHVLFLNGAAKEVIAYRNEFDKEGAKLRFLEN